MAATRFQRQTNDIRLTQSLLRHRSVTSTQKYTEASNQELQNAVQAMNWTDAAQQQEPPRPNALPDLATLTPEQLQQLAAQLAAMQAQA